MDVRDKIKLKEIFAHKGQDNFEDGYTYIKYMGKNLEETAYYSIGLSHYILLFKYLVDDYLSNYNYKILDIKEYEKIIIIENNYVLFFYMDVYSEELEELYNLSPIENEEDNGEGNEYIYYHYIVQELTYNDLFKFNSSKFHREHNTYIAYYKYDNAKLSNDFLDTNYRLKNRFKEIDDRYPDLKLQERLDNWEGIQYYYIVYELTYNNMTGYGVTRTTNSLPNSTARTLIKEYEHYEMRSYNAFSFDDNWFKCMGLLLEEAKKTSWEGVKTNNLGQHSLLAEKVKYYVVPIMMKDTRLEALISMQDEVLNNAIGHKYEDSERYLYDIVDYKWKSEELMYECVKKVFKGKKVIHQYRPYYLGRLSYDVFVCGLNLAFEYQGKQHFEPIEIFGGEENYKKQQERDAEKMEISKKNGVVLIYVNYWEDITKELIKKKYREAIDNTKREDD